jgi:hypothetical protein
MVIMDILEDINAEYKHLNAIVWFKKLCIVILLITVCAGFFIYYRNVLDKKNSAQDTIITDQLIRNYLSLNQPNKAQEQFAHQRLASAILKLSEIQALIKQNQKIKAQEELTKLLSNKTDSDLINSVARLIWMSLELDMNDQNLNQNQFHDYLAYFAKDSKRLFWGRAQVLGAIFFIKNNQMLKATELLTSVIYSVDCTNALKEEAKAVLLSINLKEQNKG